LAKAVVSIATIVFLRKFFAQPRAVILYAIGLPLFAPQNCLACSLLVAKAGFISEWKAT
jgi:hypothetical protein